jgi:hypothetical protein
MSKSQTPSTPSTIKQEFKTRITAGDEQHVTIAEFDFTDVTNEQLQALAMRSLVIGAQAVYRTAGHVPPQDYIKVADMLARERASGGRVMSVEKLAGNISKMSAADKAKMLALLQA